VKTIDLLQVTDKPWSGYELTTLVVIDSDFIGQHAIKGNFICITYIICYHGFMCPSWSKSYDSLKSNINKIADTMNSNNHESFYIQKNKYVKNQQWYDSLVFINTRNHPGISAAICPVIHTHARIIVYPDFYHNIAYIANKGIHIIIIYLLLCF
jgi:hypothetical protein